MLRGAPRKSASSHRDAPTSDLAAFTGSLQHCCKMDDNIGSSSEGPTPSTLSCSIGPVSTKGLAAKGAASSFGARSASKRLAKCPIELADCSKVLKSTCLLGPFA